MISVYATLGDFAASHPERMGGVNGRSIDGGSMADPVIRRMIYSAVADGMIRTNGLAKQSDWQFVVGVGLADRLAGCQEIREMFSLSPYCQNDLLTTEAWEGRHFGLPDTMFGQKTLVNWQDRTSNRMSIVWRGPAPYRFSPIIQVFGSVIMDALDGKETVAVMDNPEKTALVTACLHAPLDPAPRLVLSDWLEENGWGDQFLLAAVRAAGSWEVDKNGEAVWITNANDLLKSLYGNLVSISTAGFRLTFLRVSLGRVDIKCSHPDCSYPNSHLWVGDDNKMMCYCHSGNNWKVWWDGASINPLVSPGI